MPRKKSKRKSRPRKAPARKRYQGPGHVDDDAFQPRGLGSLHVGAEGDTQFRALADQLWPNNDYHLEVRLAVVQELRMNPERYEECRQEWRHDGWEQFLTNME